jgi:hypothetical protein
MRRLLVEVAVICAALGALTSAEPVEREVEPPAPEPIRVVICAVNEGLDFAESEVSIAFKRTIEKLAPDIVCLPGASLDAEAAIELLNEALPLDVQQVCIPIEGGSAMVMMPLGTWHGQAKVNHIVVSRWQVSETAAQPTRDWPAGAFGCLVDLPDGVGSADVEVIYCNLTSEAIAHTP